MVEAGSWDTNLPLSKTTRIRAVPSGEESSTVTFSFASLPLTSSIASSAQLTLNCRPLTKLTLKAAMLGILMLFTSTSQAVL
jgi:hypothetical protein